MFATIGTIVATFALYASAIPSLEHAVPTAPAPTCVAEQLAVESVPDDGGLGHQSEALLFRNNGTPCTLTGYPTVRLLDAAGRVVSIPRKTPMGYQAGLRGGPAPVVRLGRGQVANARIEGFTGPADGHPCPRYATYEVAPPGPVRSLLVPAHESVCNPEVHPIVPGRAAFYPPRTP